MHSLSPGTVTACLSTKPHDSRGWLLDVLRLPCNVMALQSLAAPARVGANRGRVFACLLGC